MNGNGISYTPKVRHSVSQAGTPKRRIGLSLMARDNAGSVEEVKEEDLRNGSFPSGGSSSSTSILNRALLFLGIVLFIPLGFALSTALKRIDLTSVKVPGAEQWAAADAPLRELIGAGNRKPVPENFECDRHNPLTDFCTLKGDIRLDLVNISINLYAKEEQTPTGTLHCAPHPRKWDAPVMATISNLSLVSSRDTSRAKTCQRYNKVPGVIISVGGYCGGVFHDFNEVLLPLFQTIQRYDGEVIIILADLKGMWWLQHSKEEPVSDSIVSQMSNYPLRILGAESDASGNKQGVECFEHLMVGVKHNLCLYSEEGGKEMRDEIKAGVHLKDFGKFVANAYHLPEEQEKVRGKGSSGKWVLGFTQRQGSRRLENYQELLMLAETRGFHVIPIFFESLSHREMVSVMRKIDVFVGVHGAAFVNCIFMRECAVVLQIMPYGEWGWIRAVGKEYKNIVERLSGSYIEYHVPAEHSSLRHKYNPSHEVIRDPDTIWRRDGELAAMAVYHNQDVYIPPFVFDFHLRHIMQVLSFQEGASLDVFDEHSVQLEMEDERRMAIVREKSQEANQDMEVYSIGWGNSILMDVPDEPDDPDRLEMLASNAYRTEEIFRRPDGEKIITNITVTLKEKKPKRRRTQAAERARKLAALGKDETTR